MLGNKTICRRSTIWTCMVVGGCLAAGTIATAEPVSTGVAELESGPLSGSAAFELVLVTAGDDLKSVSFALGDGGTAEISSGFIDGNQSGEDALVVIESDGAQTLTESQDPVGSFSRVVFETPPSPDDEEGVPIGR